MQRPTRAEIHLWLTFCETFDERLYSQYRSLLNDAENAQASRFHFTRDQHRYLITRALVRTVLSRYFPVALQDWIFNQNAFGRPEIANTFEGASDLTFNIAHTRELVVLGVAWKRALGIDVENVLERQTSLDIAQRFFSAAEFADLSKVARDLQHDRFFEYWTFKESYIKARGMGLSIPLDKFSFRYPTDNSVELSINPELNDNSNRWQFWQFRPTPRYLVAVCAERSGIESDSIQVRKVIPLVQEQNCSIEFTRTS